MLRDKAGALSYSYLKAFTGSTREARYAGA